MVFPRLRPRLARPVSLTPGDLAARADDLLRRPDAPCRGLATDHQIDLRIRETDRHFWSPQLTVIIEPRDGGSHLVGHFGPNANVWTLFMACYAFVVFSGLIGACFGLAQMFLGDPPWGLWSLPIAAVLLVLIYAAAGVGQRLGRDQVDVLEHFLAEATGSPDDGPDRDGSI
ncbi:MAG: hypothetical protein ACYTG1_09895 [Planctomycetota bacterium]|jgi:hypothetical protein